MALDAERITAALRQAGRLDQGRVSGVVVDGFRNTILSRIAKVRLEYDDASADAPASMILKTAHPDRAKGAVAGLREVEFYTEVAPGMPAGSVPQCFDAHCDRSTNAWHLLLEDLGDTHVIPTIWPLPPSMRQCERIVRVCAAVQAAWWDDPRLGVSLGRLLDAEAWRRRLDGFATEFTRFCDQVGDRLPRTRRDLFERFLDRALGLFASADGHRNITIAHGDAHVWNCFLPLDPGSDDVRLFDWDSWRVGKGSDDLAYMMAIHWYPDLRREREAPLLDHFHTALLERGIVSYDRRALDDDYRLSVLAQLMTPVWQAANAIPSIIWWNNLERVFLAVDDLGCRELLGA